RTLGRTGLRVSALGFGCGAVGGLMVRGDATAQRRAVEQALDAGVRYFDTAPSYGDGRSEENLGNVLHQIGGGPADLVVGTKCRVDPELASGPGSDAAVAQAVRDSLEASLRRLRRERVHLFQLHNRIVTDATGAGATGGLSVEQVLGPVAAAFGAVRAAGLTEHVGITGTGDTAAVKRVVEAGAPRLVDRAISDAETAAPAARALAALAPETVQVYFNALHPSAGWAGHADAGGQDFAGLIDVAATRQIGVIVIRPLAAGAIAATPLRHANASSAGGGGLAGEHYADDLTRAHTLSALAGELTLDGPVELALRFALSKPGVSTALVGFSDETQLADALRWAERGPLPPDFLQRVLTLRG
ncbi:MAG: aldo/keto reductase, partial [Chloroflexota bacterium]|nr:aldo/keto reductase [Chloroflexota bacterium]